MNPEISLKSANTIRYLSAAMVEKAKSGHPGGAMGAADFMQVLYSEFLTYDPDDLTWPFRDRFFLDPGHLSPVLYATLHLIGAFDTKALKEFRQWGSETPGHPELDPAKGVENTSGPLGMGHSFAVGAAIAEKFLRHRFGEWSRHTIYSLVSDGGIQEEISHGAARLAGFLGLSNLIVFYDANDVQLSTLTEAVTAEDTAKRYESWHWRVLEIDGHDQDQIREALKKAQQEQDKPVLIIGKTVMGKGTVDEHKQPYERKVALHGKPISKAGGSYADTIRNMGGDPDNPFAVTDEVKDYFRQVNEEKRRIVQEKIEARKKWEAKNPELAKKLEKFFKLDISHVDFDAMQPETDDASRNTSGYVLSELAGQVENMIVASADLSDSDKTNGFLKKTQPFRKGDFSGAFLNVGVSELTMGAVMNGIALHGGLIPVCGTFFVFSDYMKPAVRLAALMELPVKYIWSHDSFRVGEDGPTHQPVEQEAQMRLLEQLRNHSGNNSLLLLRPADSAETVQGWNIALHNNQSPTGMVFSRQKIKALPGFKQSRQEEAKHAEKGAYVVYESDGGMDVILLANGSEVSTLYDTAQILEKEYNIKSRIVSAPSEGLFRKQSQAYQQEVLPEGTPVVGLTAGLPVSLQGLAGTNAKILGMEHFGYSAPYKVLDEKFGYAAEPLAQKIAAHLK